MGTNFLHVLLKIQSVFSKKMHLVKPQTISFLTFNEPKAKILDLGGGGAGVIGQLYQKNVTAIDIRQNELDEAPDGPIKICADARRLPFDESSFSSATAFYFLMYLNSVDYKKVILETFRVLEEGGYFHIWDTFIPKRENSKKTLFAIPILVKLPKKTIQTAYGVKWESKFLSINLLIDLLEKTGFEITRRNVNGFAFYIECKKKGK